MAIRPGQLRTAALGYAAIVTSCAFVVMLLFWPAIGAAQRSVNRPPTQEWSDLVTALLPAADEDAVIPWERITRARLRIQWETARPVGSTRPGDLEFKGRTIMSNRGVHAAYADGRGNIDPSRPQLTTLTFGGNVAGATFIDSDLEALTYVEEALFGYHTLEPLGVELHLVKCGNDALELMRTTIWSFELQGKRQAWFQTHDMAASGGFYARRTIWLFDPVGHLVSEGWSLHDCGS